jgi:hypothetical protein
MSVANMSADLLNELTDDLLKYAQRAIERRTTAELRGTYLVCTATNILAVMMRAQEEDQTSIVDAVNTVLQESGLPYRLRATQ